MSNPTPQCCLCDSLMERGHFLCLAHWNKLSKTTRERITAAQTTVREQGKSASSDALRGLFQAQDAALDELGGAL